MTIILGLLFFLICFGSIIISFTAIVQILSNDFKESKIQWILISMIAFIGPILWLTKGRKLIIHSHNNENNNYQKISLSKHYVQLLRQIGTLEKVFFCIALALLLYGYLARIFQIYFFWESTSIGSAILLIGIIRILWVDIQSRREKKMHRIVHYLIFGFLCLTVFIQGIFAVYIPNSKGFKNATKLLKNDKELINEVGSINSFSYSPRGSMGSQSNKNGSTSYANLYLIVKGENKFVEKNIVVEKDTDGEWTITFID
jgi:hypothetical protein